MRHEIPFQEQRVTTEVDFFHAKFLVCMSKEVEVFHEENDGNSRFESLARP
jgi:hypothetical protein